MTFFGLVGLLIFIYMRLHEFVPALASIPFLYLFLGVIVLGILLDVNERRTRLIPSPQLRFVLLFWVWCLLSLLLRNPGVFVAQAIGISVCVTLYLVVAHGIQSVQRFTRTTLVIFALGLFVAVVVVHQGNQPFTCIEIIPGTEGARGFATDLLCPMVGPEGQPLDGRAKCIDEGLPGIAYICEKPGLFATTSVMGRVRYLGVLQDPNEVALATSMAVPFAFSFLELKRSMTRLALLLVTLLVVGLGVVYSQSRGGQLTFAAVLGAYFVKKYGLKRGLIGAGVLVVPLMMFGGRSSEEADESSLERLDAWAEGIKMFLGHRFTGVGYSQFVEHHYRTAHNAYILALGELGLQGMWLFIILMLAAMKIPLAVLRHPAHDEEGRNAQSLAMAMLAAFCGATVGIFFLSWTYHFVLWIHFGLSGALYATIKARDPSFEVRITGRDLAMAFGIAVAIIIGLFIQTKRKGMW
jgi:hypothetical protein